MVVRFIQKASDRVRTLILSVPIQVKIIGIGLLPVIILGITLNYWVTTGLSDWLSFIITDTRIDAAMRSGSRSVIFVTFIAAVMSIFLALFFTHLLTRPIIELKKTAQEVATGNFESRADVWANDEIGSLAMSINRMIDNFVAYKEDLTQTNQQLALTNAIARAAEEHDDIHDALFVILNKVTEYLKLDYGWVYLLDPETNKHHLASWVGVPDDLKEYLLHQDHDPICRCQEYLERGDLGNESIVQECDRMQPVPDNRESFQHLTIPIISGDMSYGVLNLHFPTERNLSDEEQGFINSIGVQVSEIVANAWYQIKLREKEAARQILLDNLVTAQEDERLRLSRELHDQTGQTLTNLLIRLKTIERKSAQEDIQEALSETQEIVSHAIENVRDISYSLRPPVLEEFGLAAAVQDLAAAMGEGKHMEVVCECGLDENISPQTEVMLYRIIQEGITNIMRHAQASRAEVKLEKQKQTIFLKIEDNGQGFDPATLHIDGEDKHLGLLSMNERAELIGGRLNMYSKPGEGTTIEVYVPLHESERA